MTSVQVSVGDLVDRITFRFADGTRVDYGGEGGTAQEEFVLEVGEELETVYVTVCPPSDLGQCCKISCYKNFICARAIVFVLLS